MKLKQALYYVQFAAFIAAILSAVAIVSYVKSWASFSSRSPEAISIEIIAVTTIALTVIITLSRKAMIKYFMRHLKYRGLFYGVCDKLNLVQNLGILPDDELLDDLYKPVYFKEEFLRDNNLSPDVYETAVSKNLLLIVTVVIPFLLGVYFLNVLHYSWHFVFIIFASSVIIGNLLVIVVKKRGRKGPLAMTFIADGLLLPDNTILPWTNIYDLEYVAPYSRGDVPLLELSFKEPVDSSKIMNFKLNSLSSSKTDVLLLFLYFKNKYGYVAG